LAPPPGLGAGNHSLPNRMILVHCQPIILYVLLQTLFSAMAPIPVMINILRFMSQQIKNNGY
jgi:hypothetical protein